MGEHTTITQGRSLCWFGGRLSPWGEWAGIESAAVVWRGGRCRRLLSDSRVPEVSAREMMELFLKMCAQAEHVCSYLLSVRCLGEIRAFDVQDCISGKGWCDSRNLEAISTTVIIETKTVAACGALNNAKKASDKPSSNPDPKGKGSKGRPQGDQRGHCCRGRCRSTCGCLCS